MKTFINRDLPNDEYQAAVGANNPSAANVFATIADITAGTGDANRVIFDAKYDQVGGIVKGQAVYISGSDGTNITVSKADYSTEATSSKTLGLAVLSGANNFQGQVISDGLLDGLDTSAAGAAGDPVWLGDDGNLIYGLLNKPYAPNHLVFIGIVTKKNASTGEIFVKVQNGFELDEIHDIDLKSNPPLDGEVLTYNALTDLWEPKPIPGVSTGGTQLLSGGASWSGTGMTFNVSTLTYTIDGVNYTSAPQNVTLAAGDPSNPRFDAIVVDATGTVSVITGIPSANPIVPSIPGTQVLVQYVLVAAGASTPSITNEFVYREGSSPDWTPVVIAGGAPTLTANFSSLTPVAFQNTECTLVNAPSYTTSKLVQYTKPSGSIARSSFPFLTFRAQLLAGSANRNILVRLYNGTTLIGTAWSSNYGLNISTTGVWQLVVIPLTVFGNAGITTATRVQFLFSGTVVGTTQIALDDIKFQSGYGPQTSTATIDILDSGTVVGSTAKLNFIDGTNTTAVVTQDVPNNKIDVQINATGISGKIGISDINGVYTYYADFASALAAATAGQTIKFFTDITTSSTNFILKNGVDIDLNGHTFETTNSGFTFADVFMIDNSIPVIVNIYNGVLKRTTGNLLVFIASSGSKINFNNVTVVSSSIGAFAVGGNGTINNVIIDAPLGYSGSGVLNNAFVTSTNNGINIAGGGEANNCVAKSTSSAAITMAGATSKLYNCRGNSSGANGIDMTGGTAINCTGISTSALGISASGGYLIGCKGNSNNNVGLFITNSNASDCYGYSFTSSGVYINNTLSLTLQSITGYSVTSNGVWLRPNSGGAVLYVSEVNGTSLNGNGILVDTNVAAVEIYNVTATCGFSTGHGISTSINQPLLIVGGSISVASTAANCIFNSGITNNIKFGNLTFKVPTGGTPVSAGIDNSAVINTPDIYGNLTINS